MRLRAALSGLLLAACLPTEDAYVEDAGPVDADAGVAAGRLPFTGRALGIDGQPLFNDLGPGRYLAVSKESPDAIVFARPVTVGPGVDRKLHEAREKGRVTVRLARRDRDTGWTLIRSTADLRHVATVCLEPSALFRGARARLAASRAGPRLGACAGGLSG